MRWFQLSRVVLSEANSRTPLPGSMRIPPRSVMAARATLLCDRVSGSSASRANSAIAPNVPRLQFVRGSAIWAARNSKLLGTSFTAAFPHTPRRPLAAAAALNTAKQNRPEAVRACTREPCARQRNPSFRLDAGGANDFAPLRALLGDE